MNEIDNEQGTADYLKVPPGTLRQWRYHRTGPPYFKVGRHVRYTREEVDRWLREQRVDAA